MARPLSRIARVALVLASAAISGRASAGPLPAEWTYTAHVRTTTGLGVLDLGTHQLLSDPSGSGTGPAVSRDYVITAPLPEASFSGSAPAAGSALEPIRLFSIGVGYSVAPAGAAPAADRGFVLTFTLTDTASGQSGTVTFTGSAGAATNDQFPPTLLFDSRVGPGSADLMLGQKHYRVTAFGARPEEIGEPANVGVQVEVLAGTPEPGTLVLAGLGLTTVGFFARRRRAACPDGTRTEGQPRSRPGGRSTARAVERPLDPWGQRSSPCEARPAPRGAAPVDSRGRCGAPHWPFGGAFSRFTAWPAAGPAGGRAVC